MLATALARPSSRTLLVILSASGLCTLLLAVALILSRPGAPAPVPPAVPQALPGPSPPDPGPATVTPSLPEYRLTPLELFFAYDQDPEAAGQKYTGKVIEISGFLTHLTPDGIGFAFYQGPIGRLDMTILSARERRWLAEGAPANVLARMGPAQQPEWTRLQRGSQVVVVGRCTGSHPDSNVWREHVVILENCRLQQE